MPQQTRAGSGPAETAADVAEVIEILAGRWQRSDADAKRYRAAGSTYQDHGCTLRGEGYRQAIAELLGVPAADVTLPLLLVATGRSDD